MATMKKRHNDINNPSLFFLAGATVFVVAAAAILIARPIPEAKQSARSISAVGSTAKRLDDALSSLRQRKAECEKKPAITPVVIKKGARTPDALPDMVLNGIVKSATKLLAFLDNRILGIGDEAEGYKVIAISDNSITLRGKDGKDKVLYLRKDEQR